MSEILLTRREVAAELRLSLRSVDYLLAKKHIEHIRIGGAVRFSRAAVDKLKEAGRVPAVA